MFYQIMITPLYALGFPDSANILSFALLGVLVWFALNLIWQHTKDSTLAWWTAASIPVGMYSVVFLITGAGNSFMVASSLGPLGYPNSYG